MAKFISMAATMLLLLACLGTARAQGEKVLKVGPNSLFKIMLFADLHYGENAWDDWGPQHDAASDKCLTTLLDSENPDFVVYLGDVLTANNFAVANATKYWDKAIAPTRAKGIPWASVFGNHDDAPFVWPPEWFSGNGIPQVVCPTGLPGEDSCRFQGTHRLDLMKNEIEKNPLSYSKNGPPNLWPSVSNYVLQVSSSTAQNQPVAFLYFFDSGGGANPSIISSAQVSWFQKTSGEVNPDSRVPELIFWHIPSKAYAEVAPNGNIAMPCVGSMNWDKVASQDGESGMMEVLTNRPSVKAVFVGHNHGNDWCCPYKTNLKLCYARHSGYGGYGTYPKGSRVIEITQQPFSIKSWIRMEDGTKHSDIVLA